MSRSVLAKPVVVITGQTDHLQINQRNELAGDATIAGCTDLIGLEQLRLQYRWTVKDCPSSDSTVCVPSSIIVPDEDLSYKQLVLLPGTLAAGSRYEFELQAFSSQSTSDYGSKKVYVMTDYPDLHCDAGTSRDASMSAPLVLDGSQSTDPAGEQLTFAWT